MIKNIKARLTAKKFNVWTGKIDPKRKADNFLAGDWIAKDGLLYYGHPLFIFFKSCHNSWRKLENSQPKTDNNDK